MANPLRAWGRRVAVRWVEWALRAPEGRAAAVRAVRELTAWHPAAPGDLAPQPYDGLGRATPRAAEPAGAVFVTARFRTGSTLLWNIFRHVPGCVAYYEPLNERRWFDPAERGSRVDTSHQGVDDYWKEYEALGHALRGLYSDDWAARELYMDASAWAPNLRRYFDALVAGAEPARAVLQCNRIDFRLPWIRRWYPGARIVHLYRHPRDQWCSSLVTPGRVPRDVTLGAFGQFDHFYLRRWARDLSGRFPVFDDGMPAYRAFYCLWRLSYQYGRAWSDCSVAFERLVQAPSDTIREVLEATGLEADADALARLVTAMPTGRWDRYAPDAWYVEQEALAEQVLAEFAALSAATPASPRIP